MVLNELENGTLPNTERPALNTRLAQLIQSLTPPLPKSFGLSPNGPHKTVELDTARREISMQNHHAQLETLTPLHRSAGKLILSIICNGIAPFKYLRKIRTNRCHSRAL